MDTDRDPGSAHVHSQYPFAVPVISDVEARTFYEARKRSEFEITHTQGPICRSIWTSPVRENVPIQRERDAESVANSGNYNSQNPHRTLSKTTVFAVMANSVMRLLIICTLLSSVRSRNADIKFDEEAQTRLVIDTSRTIATVGDLFLCATLDWWPASKCDYGSCPSSGAGILDLDLENPRLEKTLSGLAPFMVRLGGTLQDRVVYDVGNLIPAERCVPFSFNETALFSFTGGCLRTERWDALNRLFIKTGVSVAFGLNALYGRSKSVARVQVVGPWNPSNAERLIRYTRDRGYPVIAWELGNELLGGSALSGKIVPPELYASDAKKLRKIIDKLYRDRILKPSLVAPDMYYELNTPELPEFLNASGEGVIDAITRHIYNLGPGAVSTSEMISNVLNSSRSESEVSKYEFIEDLLKEHPRTSAWVGEAGGAFDGGHPEVSNSFINAFWYLDQLGTASRYNNQAFCRQSFVGSFYGLVDSNFTPNPDYYGALLWRRLMGNGVFLVDIAGGNDDIRAYAHCQRGSEGGLTLLVLNYSNCTRHHLDLRLLTSFDGSEPSSTSKKSQEDEYRTLSSEAFESRDVRLEYHMSALNGTATSRIVLLNGRPLILTPSGELPTLSPREVNSESPTSLAPLTYAYVVIPWANAPACAATEIS
ncbi:hypothetical protein R1sor_004983 [Riccia sorocarpa]|uniref:Heparanase n=1 Tax=Riccia sorocarpa TaxID=122646 RepID=A0ABD3HLR5_9MARC